MIITYRVRVVTRIEQIDVSLQSYLQIFGRMIKELQNFNDTAQSDFIVTRKQPHTVTFSSITAVANKDTM